MCCRETVEDQLAAALLKQEERDCKPGDVPMSGYFAMFNPGDEEALKKCKDYKACY